MVRNESTFFIRKSPFFIRVVGPSVALFTPPLKIFLGRTPPLGDKKEGWRAGR